MYIKNQSDLPQQFFFARTLYYLFIYRGSYFVKLCCKHRKMKLYNLYFIL